MFSSQSKIQTLKPYDTYLKKIRTGNKLRYLTEVRNAGTEDQDAADKKGVTSRGSVVPLFHYGMREKIYGCGSQSALNFVCVHICVNICMCVYIYIYIHTYSYFQLSSDTNY